MIGIFCNDLIHHLKWPCLSIHKDDLPNLCYQYDFYEQFFQMNVTGVEKSRNESAVETHLKHKDNTESSQMEYWMLLVILVTCLLIAVAVILMYLKLSQQRRMSKVGYGY